MSYFKYLLQGFKYYETYNLYNVNKYFAILFKGYRVLEQYIPIHVLTYWLEFYTHNNFENIFEFIMKSNSNFLRQNNKKKFKTVFFCHLNL